MYYIARRLEWKCNNEFFMQDLESIDSKWWRDWLKKEEQDNEEKWKHIDQFQEFHEHLENSICEGFHLADGYEKLDEALVAYITMLKWLNPEEMFIDDSLVDEFIYSHFRALDYDDEFRKYHGGKLWEGEFACTYSIHLFRKEDGVDPLDDRLGRDIDWGKITDIMVATYYPFEEKAVPEYHTVVCQNLDTLTDAEKEDVLLYCGVDVQNGSQEYQVAPGFVQNDLERVPLIYELAHDIAEADEYGFKRPQEFVALENLIKAYMKDYGLSMVDDDLYFTEWNDEEGDYYFRLRIKVFFWLKGEENQEWLEKCDEEGYYRTERREYRIIPYDDGYAVEYGPRQDLKK